MSASLIVLLLTYTFWPKTNSCLQVLRCNVMRDPQTKASKGFGFVHFTNEADMKTAVATFHDKVCINTFS